MSAFQVTCIFEQQPDELVSFVMVEDTNVITTEKVVDKVFSTLHKQDFKTLSELRIDQESGEPVVGLHKLIKFTKNRGEKGCYVNVNTNDYYWSDYRDDYFNKKYDTYFSCTFWFC